MAAMRGAMKWQLTKKLIPHNISVNDPIGPVESFCAIGCNEIVRRVFCKFCWKGLPEQRWLPFSFLEDFHNLFHYYFATFSWQMNPISWKMGKQICVKLKWNENQPKEDFQWKTNDYNRYSKWRWKCKRTYVKQTFIQSSLFWMAVKRSTTFTPISWHSLMQAWAYVLHNSFVLTSSLRNLLLNHKWTILESEHKAKKNVGDNALSCIQHLLVSRTLVSFTGGHVKKIRRVLSERLWSWKNLY